MEDKETLAWYSLDSPLTILYVKTKGFSLDLLCLLCFLPLCLSSKIPDGFSFWFVNTYIYLAKTEGVVVGGLGWQKMEYSSYAHMLICSLLFLCERSFTFQFCALMPKISKENFANIWINGHIKFEESWHFLRIKSHLTHSSN